MDDWARLSQRGIPWVNSLYLEDHERCLSAARMMLDGNRCLAPGDWTEVDCVGSILGCLQPDAVLGESWVLF